jgi:hypothetical protein
MQVGEPLHEFQGVLTGVPRYTGKEAPLLGAAHLIDQSDHRP